MWKHKSISTTINNWNDAAVSSFIPVNFTQCSLWPNKPLASKWVHLFICMSSWWCQKTELAIKQLLPHHVIKHIQNSRTKIFQTLRCGLISGRVQHHGQTTWFCKTVTDVMMLCHYHVDLALFYIYEVNIITDVTQWHTVWLKWHFWKFEWKWANLSLLTWGSILVCCSVTLGNPEGICIKSHNQRFPDDPVNILEEAKNPKLSKTSLMEFFKNLFLKWTKAHKTFRVTSEISTLFSE